MKDANLHVIYKAKENISLSKAFHPPIFHVTYLFFHNLFIFYNLFFNLIDFKFFLQSYTACIQIPTLTNV